VELVYGVFAIENSSLCSRSIGLFDFNVNRLDHQCFCYVSGIHHDDSADWSAALLDRLLEVRMCPYIEITVPTRRIVG
jgi:hypothetical protein